MAAQQPDPTTLGILRFLCRYVRFDSSCTADAFCTGCGAAACSHCCGRQHVRAHHPNQEVHYAEVLCLEDGFGYAVEVADMKCGYCWNGIRKVRYGSYKMFVPLRRRDEDYHEPVFTSCPCGDPLPERAGNYCSLNCRFHAVEGGNALGRHRVQALLNAEFEEGHGLDRFCTKCLAFHSFFFCPDHVNAHHPGRGRLIEVIRSDGRVLVPAMEFPQLVTGEMETFEVEGQQGLLVQIIPARQEMGLAPGLVGPGSCSRCGLNQRFCSLLCKAFPLQWLGRGFRLDWLTDEEDEN